MNNFALNEISIVPLRAEPKETAEMVSQMLFGEIARVLDMNEKWLRIELPYDNYSGWVDRKMVSPLSEDEFDTLLNETCPLVSVPFTRINTLRGHQLVPFGSYIRKGLILNYQASEVSSSPLSIAEIVTIASQFTNSPYLWGGKTVFGIDCSGFVQMLFRLRGIDLPRDASQQVECGKKVSNIPKMKPGDLAFFGDNKRVTHVGMVTQKNQLIHASGWVKTETLDEIGIYNNQTKSYSHKLITLKRYD